VKCAICGLVFDNDRARAFHQGTNEACAAEKTRRHYERLDMRPLVLIWSQVLEQEGINYHRGPAFATGGMSRGFGEGLYVASPVWRYLKLRTSYTMDPFRRGTLHILQDNAEAGAALSSLLLAYDITDALLDTRAVTARLVTSSLSHGVADLLDHYSGGQK